MDAIRLTEKRLSECANLRAAVDRDVELLEKQIVELKMQISNRRASQRALDASIECEIRVRSQCVAAMMYAKVPREIRDLIYEFACVEDGTLYIKHWDRTDRSLWAGSTYKERYRGRPRAVPLHEHESLWEEEADDLNPGEPELDLLDGLLYPDYEHDKTIESETFWARKVLDPAYVGETVAREATLIYYSKNTFLVAFDRALHAFLTLDLRGLGTKPKEHIRHLTAIIRCEPLEISGYFTDDRAGVHEVAFLEAKRKHLDRGLRLVSSKTNLDLFIRLDSSSIDPTGPPSILITTLDEQRCFYNILEAIWGPIAALKRERGFVTSSQADPGGSTEMARLFGKENMERRKKFKGGEKWHEGEGFISRSEMGALGAEGLEEILKRRWGIHEDFW